MSACEHDMVVSPDPANGRNEVVRCLLCGQKRTRVAVAESIREQAASELATMRGDVVSMRESISLEASALRAEMAALRERVALLEAKSAT